MAEAKITINVDGNAADGLQEITGAVGAVDQAADKLAKSLLAAFSVQQVASSLREWTLQADALSDAMTTLGGRSADVANVMGIRMVDAIDQATARNRLLQAGLDVTDEQYRAITLAAVQYAQANNQDVGQSLASLTQALVTGNDRGLRPYNLGLQEGADRATNQRDALEALTRQVEQNEASIRQNMGTLDAWDAVWGQVKEAIGATSLALLDLPFQAINEALTGPNGLVRGIDAFVEGMIRIQSGMPNAIAGFGSLESSVWGYARALLAAASLVPGNPIALNASVVDAIAGGGSGGSGGDAAQPGSGRFAFDLDNGGRRAGSSFDMTADVRGRRRGGGGGGGGGARDTRSAEVRAASDAVAAFSDSLEEERELLEQSRRALTAWADAHERAVNPVRALADAQGVNIGANVPGRTAGANLGGTSAGNRGAAQTTRQLQGTANAAGAATQNLERTGSAYEQLAQVGTTALGSLTSALNAHVSAWVMGEETIGQAIQGILAQTMLSIATEATVKALLSFGEAAFWAITGNEPAAAAALTAGGYYTAAAVAAGAAAAGAGVGNTRRAAGGGGGGGAGGRGTSTPRDLGPGDRSGAPGGNVSITYVLGPGSVIGTNGMREFVGMVDRQRNDAARIGRHQPRISQESIRRA